MTIYRALILLILCSIGALSVPLFSDNKKWSDGCFAALCTFIILALIEILIPIIVNKYDSKRSRPKT